MSPFARIIRAEGAFLIKYAYLTELLSRFWAIRCRGCVAKWMILSASLIIELPD